MTSSDVKVDPQKTWVRATQLIQVVIVTALVTAGYMRFEFRMGAVEQNQLADRQAIVGGLREVRDQLGKVFIDSIAVRQAQSWIESARVLNREKNPSIIWPDLPR